MSCTIKSIIHSSCGHARRSSCIWTLNFFSIDCFVSSTTRRHGQLSPIRRPAYTDVSMLRLRKEVSALTLQGDIVYLRPIDVSSRSPEIGTVLGTGQLRQTCDLNIGITCTNPRSNGLWPRPALAIPLIAFPFVNRSNPRIFSNGPLIAFPNMTQHPMTPDR